MADPGPAPFTVGDLAQLRTRQGPVHLVTVVLAPTTSQANWTIDTIFWNGVAGTYQSGNYQAQRFELIVTP